MPWTVELLPQAERELLAMPPDIQAQFVRIAELLEERGAQDVGMPHVRPLEAQAMGNAHEGQGRHCPRRVCGTKRATPHRAACI